MPTGEIRYPTGYCDGSDRDSVERQRRNGTHRVKEGLLA